MKLRNAIWIDKYLVGGFNRLLNVMVRATGWVLRPDHRLDKPFRTIAICKFKGMGSIIQAGPMIQTLKKNYPDSKIIFITTPGNRRILELIPEVDEIITLNDSGFFSLLFGAPLTIGKLMRRRIGLYIDLEIYSNFSSSVAAMSCARNRVGFYLRSEHYKMGLYTHMMFYNVNIPIRETYLQMARILPLKEEVPQLPALNENTTKLRPEFLKQLSELGDYLVINCNASDLREERKWPLENFRELILQLRSEKKLPVVLIGAASEQDYVGQLHAFFSEDSGVINLSGKTNLDELIHLIRRAKLMLTNDTGPMHLAFATSTPTLALFGPCSPLQYGNFPGSFSIYHQVYCSPCVHEFLIPPCKGNNICMKKISVSEVKEKAQAILENRIHPEQAKDLKNVMERSQGYLPGLVKRQKNEKIN
jgi:ADP-heptose:LPS heptosyltransferase